MELLVIELLKADPKNYHFVWNGIAKVLGVSPESIKLYLKCYALAIEAVKLNTEDLKC